MTLSDVWCSGQSIDEGGTDLRIMASSTVDNDVKDDCESVICSETKCFGRSYLFVPHFAV